MELFASIHFEIIGLHVYVIDRVAKIITPHYDTMMTSLTVVFLSDFRLNYDVYYSGIYYTTATTAAQ